MSPLIDCVFLLLIFFLATSMLKRWEHQIPIDLPESTSAIADQAADRTQIIGVTRRGQFVRAVGRGDRAAIQYERVDDLAGHLKRIADAYGHDVPLQISTHPETPFQLIIDTVDLCKLAGFQNVSVQLSNAL